MKSLQTRLVSIAVVFAVGFLLASIAIYIFSKKASIAEFDEAIFATARALAALTEESFDGQIEFKFTDGFEEFSRNESPSYYQFWLDGQPLARSPHLTSRDLRLSLGKRMDPRFDFVMLPDGRPGRQVCITFHPAADDWDEEDEDIDVDYPQFHSTDPSKPAPTWHGTQEGLDAVASQDSGVMTLTWEREQRNVTIAVARGTAEMDRNLASLLWILPIVGIATTLFSSGVLVFVVNQGLKPVQAAARAIAAIDENSLSDRVATNKVPTEIAPMVRRLNDLLERLENAFHRERAFSSNLAHELRTPLAGLKSTLEVHLSRLHEPEQYQDAMRVCLEICDQSENLVENLLSLARVENGSHEYRYESVNLHDLVEECWQPLSGLAADKSLSTRFELIPIVITSDREMLRVILRNVLSNAVQHALTRGEIGVGVQQTAEKSSIVVENTTTGLRDGELANVFDRLWRGDHARAQTGEHFGLGLTLAKRLVESLGGSIQATANGTFRITISFPV